MILTMKISQKMKLRLKMGTNEKKAILKLLYKRLRNEFETYQHWLMRQPKKEILRLAPDYLVRKAIVEAAKRYTRLDASGRHYLFNDQVETLLRSKTPLEDICGEFFLNSDYCRLVFGDSIENAFESFANDVQRREFLAAKMEGNN